VTIENGVTSLSTSLATTSAGTYMLPTHVRRVWTGQSGNYSPALKAVVT